MRESLFRGKRVDNGDWTYGYLFVCWDGCYILWGMSGDNPIKEEVVPETVGEYTGLTDKNGKKIFEGDIIAPAVLSNVPPCEVMFDVAEGQFVVKDACGDFHGILASFGRIFDNRYTVVGNKWDNPELLEVIE